MARWSLHPRASIAGDVWEYLRLPVLDPSGLIPWMTTVVRVLICQERYAITACTTSFCGPCTWCQIARGSQMRKNTITFVNMSQYESLTETSLPSFVPSCYLKKARAI
uniref:Uncharacterized protein n=2 Tax=Oreochromis TaxID=8139 RepID=A0A669BFZ1_ORENI